MEMQFLGATGTVTGSKYLVRVGGRKILVDCGLFQGYKQLRLRNRTPLPVNPREIDAVILTHAHLDHSGYLPLLIKNGYAGKVYCTQATRDVCAILLPDSGRLQEEEAEYANRHKYSKHAPALPLYTREDAEYSLLRFIPVDFARDVDLGGGLTLHLLPAGHMLGSSFVRLRHDGKTLLFTGDLGRPNDLIMVALTVVDRADYLVVESTYGDRRHDPTDPQQRLAEVINRTVKRGGAVIVPAFAVGRAQTLMYLIHLLKESNAIPDLPRNTILFVGFQAGGTRGAAMLNGAETIKIHGEYVPVRAEVVNIDNLSAHADYAEILAWLEHFESPPRQTFVTHGEPKAADALRHRIEENLGWRTCVPEYLETVPLESARPAAHGARGAS